MMEDLYMAQSRHKENEVPSVWFCIVVHVDDKHLNRTKVKEKYCYPRSSSSPQRHRYVSYVFTEGLFLFRFVVPGIEPKVLCLLTIHTITVLHSQFHWKGFNQR
jgi:hypothetical protein